MNDTRGKTLVITSSYPSGAQDAAGHFVEAEVRLLRQTGEEVHVFAAGAGPEINRPKEVTFFAGGAQLFDHPGALPRLKERPLRLFGVIAPSIRAFSRSRGANYDRIIAHWLFPGAMPWAYFFCSPTARLEVVLHGSDVRLATRLPPLVLNTILEALVRRRAQFRIVSKALQAELLQCRLSPGARTAILQATVRPAALVLPEIPTKSAARRRLGVSPESRLVAIVARLVSTKRVQTALCAAELIPNASIVVLGDGPLIQDLRQQFSSARFIGQQPRDVALTWLQAADLLISASQLEGAPTTIREARQLGTPVVTVEAGDVLEWAESDPELHVVSPRD